MRRHRPVRALRRRGRTQDLEPAIHRAAGRRSASTRRLSPSAAVSSPRSSACVSSSRTWSFVVGSPEDRRRFFDQTLVLSDLSFLDSLRGYRQVLKSRNLCLRENREDLLDVYDAQLAALGSLLQERRAELVRRVRCTVFDPLLRRYQVPNRRSGSATVLPGTVYAPPTK